MRFSTDVQPETHKTKKKEETSIVQRAEWKMRGSPEDLPAPRTARSIGERARACGSAESSTRRAGGGELPADGLEGHGDVLVAQHRAELVKAREGLGKCGNSQASRAWC